MVLLRTTSCSCCVCVFRFQWKRCPVDASVCGVDPWIGRHLLGVGIEGRRGAWKVEERGTLVHGCLACAVGPSGISVLVRHPRLKKRFARFASVRLLSSRVRHRVCGCTEAYLLNVFVRRVVMPLNISLGTDTQREMAALRAMLRAGQLRR